MLVLRPEQSRQPERLVAVGKLGRPWGVRGGLIVHLHNPESDLAWAGEIAWLAGERFKAAAVEVEHWEDKGGILVVRFAGVESPEDAADLTHMELMVAADLLPETNRDETYVHELVGMRVIDTLRGDIGRIAGVFCAGSTDVWVVQGEAGEELIPAVRDFVLGIDRETRVVSVRWEVE